MSVRSLSGNKRGQFLSLIAMLLLLLMAMQLQSSEKPVLQTEAESTETKFEIAVNLLRNIETAVIPRMLDADVSTALDGISRCLNDSIAGAADEADHFARAKADCYASNDGFYADETQVIGIVRNATLGLPVPPGVAPYISNANINVQLEALQKVTKAKFKFILKIEPTLDAARVDIGQDNSSGPNGINVKLPARLGLDASFANWNGRIIEPNSTVAIDGLLDPYILVQVEKALKATAPRPADTAFNPRVAYYIGNLTAETLPNIALNRTYQFEPMAPSFIARFTGNVSQQSDCCGIESLIALNPDAGTTAGVPAGIGLRRRPMVDWCYWREHTADETAWCTEASFASELPELQKVALWRNTGVTNDFALESYHIMKYMNESLAVYITPENECSCNMALCERVFDGLGCSPLPAGGDDSCDWFGPPPPGTCGTPATP